MSSAEGNERVDQTDHGALIFFRERGRHLKSLPQAAGLGAVRGVLVTGTPAGTYYNWLQGIGQ